MERLRRRHSPIILVSHDELLSKIYPNNAEPCSFLNCLKRTEKLEYVASIVDSSGQSQTRRLFIRISSPEEVQTYTPSRHKSFLSTKWTEVDQKQQTIDETLQELSSVAMEGISLVRPASTMDHPAACIHATSDKHPNPLQWLLTSQKSLSSRLQPLQDKDIGSDILHYFVLVRTEDTVGGCRDAQVNGLFAEMCRHFGHNTSQVIVHQSKSFDEDSASWEVLMRSFVAQSLVLFMHNFVSSGFQGYSMRNPMGMGLAGRLLSAGKKWLAPSVDTPGGNTCRNFDSPEYLTRRAADFSFMMGDWNQALNVIETALASTNLSEAVIKLRILKAFSLSTIGNLQELSTIFREVELIAELAQASEENALEAVAFTLCFFIIAPHVSENVKLAVYSRLSECPIDMHIKALLATILSRLYAARGAYRHALLGLFHSAEILDSLKNSHLVKLSFDELSGLPETKSIRFINARFVICKRQYELAIRPDPGMALELLDSFNGLLDAQFQSNLIQALRFKLERIPVKFLKVVSKDCYFKANNLGKMRLETIPETTKNQLENLCDTISLVLGYTVDSKEIWHRSAHVFSVGSEKLLFFTVLVSDLLVPISLTDISLQMESEDGSNHSISIENGSISIGPRDRVEVFFALMPQFIGSFKAKSLCAVLEGGSVPIILPIEDPGKEAEGSQPQRLMLKGAASYNLHVYRELHAPRLGIRLEGLSFHLFEYQDIQATIVVSNTGEADAHEVLVFCTGIDNFPTSGISIGNVRAGVSAELPLSFQLNRMSSATIVLFVAEKDRLGQGVFWTKVITPQSSLKVSTRVTMLDAACAAKSVLLVTARNISGKFISSLQPKICVNDNVDYITSLPASIDMLPSHDATFLFRENPAPLPKQTYHSTDTQIFIDCIISGEPIRFCFPLSTDWSPFTQPSSSCGFEMNNHYNQISFCDLKSISIPPVVAFSHHPKNSEQLTRPLGLYRKPSMTNPPPTIPLIPTKFLNCSHPTFYYEKSSST